ncbi:fibronectin type III domain-containing protein [Paenibacillus chitinolyticus]|uniref:fibronectin type III domain-containing protein n=1 Tax=Paenibacillus chitinolyticus TaxID=79263 RepID=UPI0038700B68
MKYFLKHLMMLCSLLAGIFIFVPLQALAAPSAPTGLKVVGSPGSTSVSLSWTAATGATGGYNIYRNGNGAVDALSGSTTSTSYTVTGLNSGASYSFYVKAKDSKGVLSGASNSVSVKTADVSPPSAPSGLTSSISGTNLTLSWSPSSDNVGVTSYTLYKAYDGGSYSASGTYTSTTTGSFSIVEGRTYKFKVAASDAAGNVSAYSNEVNVFVDYTPPTAPSGLTLSSKTATSVSLSWNASSDNVGVSSYEVFRTGNGATNASSGTTSGTSMTVSGLNSGAAYTFYVKAKDSKGNVSGASSSLSVTLTVPDTQAPTAPANLRASLSGTDLSLTWTGSTDNVGVQKYNLYKAYDGGGYGIHNTYTSTGTGSFVIVEGRSYKFKVTAVDAAGNESSASNEIAVQADVTPPSIPANLKVVSFTDTKVSLSWSASTDNVGVVAYDIYRTGNGAVDQLSATVSSTSATVDSLNSGATYSFYVKARDAKGLVSAASPAVKVTMQDLSGPTAPGNLKASLSGLNLTLTWTASTDNVGVVRYRLYKAYDGGGYEVHNQYETTSAAFGIVEGRSYKFKVTALDAAGNESPASGEVSVLVDTTAPSAPTNVRITGTTETTVSLAWSASTDNVGVTGYEVYRTGNGAVNELSATATGTSVTVTGLNNGASYSFYVVAKDAKGNKSPASGSVNVSLDTQAPSAPGNLKASLSGLNLTLTWTASTDNVGVARYRLYKAYDGGGYEVHNQYETTSAAFGIVEGRSYKFKVTALDAAGNESPASGEVSVLVDTTAPSAPTNVRITGTTETTVSLAWSASTDNVSVTGYEVYRTGNGAVNELSATATGTSVTVTGLNNGASYSFYVVAKDAKGNKSPASGSVNVSLDTQAPSAPGNLKASLSGLNLTLTWTASTDNVGVARYRLYKAYDGGGYEVHNQYETTSAAFGIVEGRSYKFKVTALDAAGNESPASGEVSVLVDTTAPSAPTNVRITGTTETTVSLAWSASTDNVGVTGYEVYRTGNGAVNELSATATGTSVTVTGLNNGASYSFYVVAKDAKGNKSPASGSVKVSTDMQPPTAPGNLKAVLNGLNVTLTWMASTDNTAVDYYRVYKAYDSVDYGVNGNYETTGTGSFALVEGRMYKFKVTAVDKAGNESPPSNEVTVEAFAEPLAPPTGLVVSNLGESGLTLSWTASPSGSRVSSYAVYRTGNGATNQLTASTSGTSVAIDSLNSGAAYSFYVKAKDASGVFSAASVPVSVTMKDLKAPSAPSGLAASTSGNQLTLTWTASADNVGVTGYVLYKAYDNGAFTPDGTYTGTSASFPIVEGRSYQFMVKAVDAAGNASPGSNTVAVWKGVSPPSGLKVTGVTETTVDLEWTSSRAQSGIAAYEIYRTGNGANQVLSGTTSGNTVKITGLNRTATYTFYIQARDSKGNVSAPSELVTVNMQGKTVVDGPALQASANGSLVTLSWTMPPALAPKVSKYVIYKSYDDGDFLVNGLEEEAKTTIELVQGRAYKFKVKALYKDGTYSKDSNEVSVLVGVGTPANVVAVSVKETTVQLKWTGSKAKEGIAQYEVYRTGEGTSGVLAGTTVDTAITLTGLARGTSYEFFVKAKDTKGNYSVPSNPTVKVTTRKTFTESPLLTLKSRNGQQIKLSWSYAPDSPVASYKLYRTVDGEEYVTANIPAAQSSFDYTLSQTDKTYSFYLRAVEGDGSLSDSSNEVIVREASPPTAPKNLVLTSNTGDRIGLKWSPSTDNVGVEYYLILKSGNGADDVSVMKVEAPKTEAVISLPQTGLEYMYQVQAVDEAGNRSPSSNSVTASSKDAETGEAGTLDPEAGFVVDPDDIEAFISANSSKLSSKQKQVLRTKINLYASNPKIRSTYVEKLTGNPLVFFFEGATDDVEDHKIKGYHQNGRYRAMAVVIKKKKIVDVFTDASTLSDDPDGRNSSGQAMATTQPGVYPFHSGIHHPDKDKGYAALLMDERSNFPVFRGASRKESNDGGGINIHMGFDTHPISEGCLIIHKSSFNRFADAVGFRKPGVTIEKGVKQFVNVQGYAVIDRSEDPSWGGVPSWNEDTSGPAAGEISGSMPANYQPYIDQLKKAHPNWSFNFYPAGMSLDYLVSKEYNHNNPTPKTDLPEFKETNQSIIADRDQYELRDGNFFLSKRSGVDFFANPLHFLNDNRVGYGTSDGLFYDDNGLYMFLDATFDESSQKLDSLKSMMKGTYFAKDTDRYASLFYNAAKASDVNAYILLSKAFVEGKAYSNPPSSLVSGYAFKGKTVYNFFGIGAYDGNALSKGAQRAYDEGWFTEKDAIEGGAKLLKKYTKDGQDTLYKTRYNLDVLNKTGNVGKQYASNIADAFVKGSQLNKKPNYLLDKEKLVFNIPVFESSAGKSRMTANSLLALTEDSESPVREVSSAAVTEVVSGLFEGLDDTRKGIMVNFDAPLDPGEAFDEIVLSNGSSLVPVTYTVYGHQLYVVPEIQLDANLSHSLIIPDGALYDGNGDKIALQNIPVAYGDKTSLILVSSSPADQAAGVKPNETVQLNWNEDIQPGDAFGTIAITTSENENVEINPAIQNNQLLLTPKTEWEPGKSYTVHVPAKAVKSSSGIGNEELSISFRTAERDIEPPSAPAELRMTDRSGTSIGLAWKSSNDNTGIAGYDVFRSSVRVGSSVSPNYTVTGLTYGETYTFTVIAKDLAGNVSVPSESLTAATLPDTEPPSPPGQLAETDKTGTTIGITWTEAEDNAGVTAYEIYSGSVLLGVSTTNKFTIGPLAYGLTYTVTVRARDAAGNVSLPSPSIVVKTLDDREPPAAPKNVVKTGLTPTRISLRWDASTDSGGNPVYSIFYGQKLLQTTTLTRTTVYLEEYMLPGSSYTIRVAAHYFGGAMSEPTPLTVTIPLDTIAPSTPTGLMTIQETTETTVHLFWPPAPDNYGVAGYYIYDDGKMISYLAMPASSFDTPGSYFIEGLVPGSSHSFTIQAKDHSGNVSGISAPLQIVTLPDMTPPSKPAEVAGSVTADSAFRITWTASADNVGVAGYEIYEDARLIGTSVTNAYTVTGATYGKPIELSVKARDAAGNLSEASDILRVVLGPQPQAIPPSGPMGRKEPEVPYFTVDPYRKSFGFIRPLI